MGIYKNAKGQYYAIKRASQERDEYNGGKIAKGETYLRFYEPVSKSNDIVVITLTKTGERLKAVGNFKLPDNIYRETGLYACRCDRCGVYFLGLHERFCCEAHGQTHFEMECSC